MDIRKLCRDLRKNQTEAETILWARLRNRKLDGVKFNRQYPVFYSNNDKQKFFILDFYSHEYQLAIEVDGKIHDKQKEYDAQRTTTLNEQQIFVLRFTNKEVINNTEFVLYNISPYITNHPSFKRERGRG